MQNRWNQPGNALLSGLSPEDLQTMLCQLNRYDYAEGEHIYFQGDIGDYLFLVSQGSVKLYTVTSDGNEKVLGVFHGGEIFGELFLGKYRHRMGHAQAMSKVALYRVDKETFLRLISQFPSLAFNIIQYFAEKRRDSLIRLYSVLDKDPKSCLLGTILSLIYQYGGLEQNVDTFTLPKVLTQQDIANFSGLNRTTVSATINEMRREGILGGRGRTVTVNIPRFKLALSDIGLALPELGRVPALKPTT